MPSNQFKTIDEYITNGASSGSTVTILAERTNIFLSEPFRFL